MAQEKVAVSHPNPKMANALKFTDILIGKPNKLLEKQSETIDPVLMKKTKKSWESYFQDSYIDLYLF